MLSQVSSVDARAAVRSSFSVLASMACGLGLLCGAPAMAQSPTADELELRARIEELRAEQARITELQQKTEAQLQALEARLGVTSPDLVASAPKPPFASPTSRLKVSGDLRLRSQGDYSDVTRSRTSAQVRGRLGATFAVNDWITLGGRLATGDPDDPNSTDVQLSNFDEDLQFSLDLAYAQLTLGDLKLYGGKLPQPFARTDLVWDSDVNPQGVGAVYKRQLPGGSALRASGLYFLVDEQAAGADSTMLGAQLGYDSPPTRRLEIRSVGRLLRLPSRQHRWWRRG